MNAFNLKAALLAKDAQKPVINPRTHGVVHRSSVLLVNFNLPPISRVCEKWRHHLLATDLLFF
jgi:hypothetical protein